MKPFFIFGTNTNVGKTFFSKLICEQITQNKNKIAYIKPVQTGYPMDDDEKDVRQNCDKDFFYFKTLLRFQEPVSPHFFQFSQTQLMHDLKKEIDFLKQENFEYLLIEGAGGVASPLTKNVLQCDFYRPLRFPVILIADSNLGGISSTISSAEFLKMKGFDIAAIFLMESSFENETYLQNYFKNQFPVFMNPAVKPGDEALQPRDDVNLKTILDNYYLKKNETILWCQEMAKNHFWWPFTQHQLVNSISYVESAYAENIVFQEPWEEKKDFYEAHQSWWTQSVGHAHPVLVQEMATLAGRYGHVMFPKNTHEPAAKLVKLLRDTVGKNWASRVFFSDNGSTAIEIAIKIAFRFSFGKEKNPEACVLGLKDSYHGDTHGCLNATSPNVFKKKDHWYFPKGIWLDYPKIIFKNGNYSILFQNHYYSLNTSKLKDLFLCESRILSSISIIYEDFFQYHFSNLNISSIGACLIEGVIQGSAGMIFVDPLFLKMFIEKCQLLKIPVIVDEIFTGFFRLGEISSCEMLGVKPDIACYGKNLTGGLIPFSVTLCAEKYFEKFLGNTLEDALLHGHSFTGNPISCGVAAKNIELLVDLHQQKNFHSFWSQESIQQLSYHPFIQNIYSLGTLLVLELKSDNSGYLSQEAQKTVEKLREFFLDVRPLGDVIYCIAPLNAKSDFCPQIFSKISFLFPSNDSDRVQKSHHPQVFDREETL